MKYRVLIACLLMSITSLAAGGLAADAECGNDTLRLAVIPKKSSETLVQEYQPLLEHLRTGLGMPVEIVQTSSYEGVVDAVVSGGVDIAWLGPASYLLAWQRDPRIEPFASLAIKQGHFTQAGNSYHALLLVRGDRRAGSLADIRGDRVALSDPSSTSGSLIPHTEFATAMGVPLAEFFVSRVYTGSHDNALDTLLQGGVDAAFVASIVTQDYLRKGRIDEESVRVLWRSAPIYYDPYVFRGALCERLKTEIKALMLADDPALEPFFQSQQATGMMPAHHGHYENLLKYMGQ